MSQVRVNLWSRKELAWAVSAPDKFTGDREHAFECNEGEAKMLADKFSQDYRVMAVAVDAQPPADDVAVLRQRERAREEAQAANDANDAGKTDEPNGDQSGAEQGAEQGEQSQGEAA